MPNICVIPARGGSKRLPRKNVADFLGKPIITYSIEAALACSELFERVIVSTEDSEISDIAKSAGAEVLRRSPELATDTARIVDVCIDVLDQEQASGREYESFCCLFATAPLRTADDIRATVNLIDPPSCHFSMAVTHYDLPAHQALHAVEDGSLEPMWPEWVNRRSQDVGELLCDNGSTYAAATKHFRKHRTFHGPGVRGFKMPRWRSIDIDLPEDMELAIYFAARLQQDTDQI